MGHLHGSLNIHEGIEKCAFIGPLLDIMNLGIPSGVGYAIGRTDHPRSKEQAEKYLRSHPSIAAALLMPGYTGYRIGRKSSAREAIEDAKLLERRPKD